MVIENDSDVILLVDTDNAINYMNQNVTLHRIWIICPIIATSVMNSNSQNARLSMSRGDKITSTEGTTQGDSIIILIYVLRSLLLLNMTTTDNTKVSTFVDDISCVGKLKNIKLGGKYWIPLVLKLDIFQKQKKITINYEVEKIWNTKRYIERHKSKYNQWR